MADNPITMIVWLFATMAILFVCLVFGSFLVDSPVNYPLGTEVTTTDEYNAYCDEVTGHIVMQKIFGVIVVENEAGERKEFKAEQIREVDKP